MAGVIVDFLYYANTGNQLHCKHNSSCTYYMYYWTMPPEGTPEKSDRLNLFLHNVKDLKIGTFEEVNSKMRTEKQQWLVKSNLFV